MTQQSPFGGSGMHINGMWHLSAKEAFALLQQEAVLIDLRPEQEVAFKCFSVSQVIRCPFYEFDSYVNALSPDMTYILADAVGIHSKECTLKLLEAGFVNVGNLAGGFVDWEREGFPVGINSKEALSGPCLCMLKPMRKLRALKSQEKK